VILDQPRRVHPERDAFHPERDAFIQNATRSGIKEDNVLKLESNAARFVDLQAPEVLEFKTAPMFMCCGSWVVSFTINPITIFSFTLTWAEDPDAACSGWLF
jgi:hypothetical protein